MQRRHNKIIKANFQPNQQTLRMRNDSFKCFQKVIHWKQKEKKGQSQVQISKGAQVHLHTDYKLDNTQHKAGKTLDS